MPGFRVIPQLLYAISAPWWYIGLTIQLYPVFPLPVLPLLVLPLLWPLPGSAAGRRLQGTRIAWVMVRMASRTTTPPVTCMRSCIHQSGA